MSDGTYTNLKDEVDRVYALRREKREREEELLSRERTLKRREVRAIVSAVPAAPVVKSPLADKPRGQTTSKSPLANKPRGETTSKPVKAEKPSKSPSPEPSSKSVKAEKPSTSSSSEPSTRESAVSTSSLNVDESAVEISNANIEDPSQPEWYSNSRKVDRVRVPSGIDEVLNKLRTGMDNCAKAVHKGLPPSQADLDKVNDALHKAAFLEVTGLMLRKKRILHNDSGLSQLFSSEHSRGVSYPWYIQEDAAELYTKWWSADFSPNLFRGIDVGKKKNAKLGRESVAPHIIKTYAKRSGKFFGSGNLRNGQWWPSQLCAVRDGAHASTMAGIAGVVKEGAFSCVMSGGPYQNIDRGNEVWYYGTASDGPSTPTESTQRMKENLTSGQPVRLLRSSKINDSTNKYKPTEGMRYDGLYKVAGFEIKKIAKQIHLFHLVRLDGQGTIRYQGPEVRPTLEECEALAKAKVDKSFLA